MLVARAIATSELQIPSIDPEGFRQRIGSSVVEEFVAGHDPPDVLAELVQNEFDAGGTAMSIDFGESALTITGSGRPIDEKGWSRLGVIIGTGSVVGNGESEDVQAKVNGIGSKNFGPSVALRVREPNSHPLE